MGGQVQCPSAGQGPGLSHQGAQNRPDEGGLAGEAGHAGAEHRVFSSSREVDIDANEMSTGRSDSTLTVAGAYVWFG